MNLKCTGVEALEVAQEMFLTLSAVPSFDGIRDFRIDDLVLIDQYEGGHQDPIIWEFRENLLVAIEDIATFEDETDPELFLDKTKIGTILEFLEEFKGDADEEI